MEEIIVKKKSFGYTTFYVNSGVYPIDLYPSYNPKNDRKIIVMIFLRSDTIEVYKKWCNYESN